jgi:hypothetical protein
MKSRLVRSSVSLTAILVACLSAGCGLFLAAGNVTSAEVLLEADMSRLLGGAGPNCNEMKGQSIACSDTTPASCPSGATIYCEPDPDNTTRCRKHAYNTYEKCQDGNGAYKNWHCIPNDQGYGCVNCMQATRVNGQCPEASCTVYGTCGNHVQKPESKGCKE